ncbi:MAG: hypothetical protein ACNA8W_14110, partial [Bradymonadaceae bacterium]
MNTKQRMFGSLLVISLATAPALGCSKDPDPVTGDQDVSSPDATAPDVTTTPDASTPDASAPDATTPDASAPDASAPDATTPDASADADVEIIGGDQPNPMLLPAAAGQGPQDGFTYGRNLNAGESYVDPVSGVQVYKVTDSTTPVENTGAYHAYSGGGPLMSQPWESDGKTFYSLQFYTNGTWHLVDFNETDGTFDNWRASPGNELQLAWTL